MRLRRACSAGPSRNARTPSEIPSDYADVARSRSRARAEPASPGSKDMRLLNRSLGRDNHAARNLARGVILLISGYCHGRITSGWRATARIYHPNEEFAKLNWKRIRNNAIAKLAKVPALDLSPPLLTLEISRLPKRIATKRYKLKDGNPPISPPLP